MYTSPRPPHAHASKGEGDCKGLTVHAKKLTDARGLLCEVCIFLLLLFLHFASTNVNLIIVYIVIIEVMKRK